MGVLEPTALLGKPVEVGGGFPSISSFKAGAHPAQASVPEVPRSPAPCPPSTLQGAPRQEPLSHWTLGTTPPGSQPCGAETCHTFAPRLRMVMVPDQRRLLLPRQSG